MKKTTNRKLFGVIMTLVLVLSLFASCAKAMDSEMVKNEIGYVSGSSSSNDGGIGSLPSGETENPNAKVIKTAYATLKTKEYDTFIESVYLKINELGGYTDKESFNGSAPYRYSSIVVRVPSEKLADFKDALSNLGTLTNYTATKEDVTLTYSTLKAKVETLTLEAEAVEELFGIAKAEGKTSAISELQSKLFDLKLEINEANAKISAYDNSIAYSTVYLNVNEVREIVIEEEKKGAFVRIGENLKNNLSDIGNFFVEFFIWFVSAIPYLIIIGGIATGAVFAFAKIKKIRKSSKPKETLEDKKDDGQKDENTDENKEEQK